MAMKIKGRSIKGPNRDFVVIPRPKGPDGENQDIVFEAEAVLDYGDFEKLCPVPMPPIVTRPGNIQSENVEDPDYKKKLAQHNRQRYDWMVLQSLQITEGLEWEQVKADDPETWSNYEAELRASD